MRQIASNVRKMELSHRWSLYCLITSCFILHISPICDHFVKIKIFSIYIFPNLRGVFDIVGVVAIQWTRNESKIGFGPSFEIITRFALSLTGTTFLTHVLGCLLMTLSRYTAVFYPTKQNYIWKQRNVCIILAFDIAISFLVYSSLYLNKVRYSLEDDGWHRRGREKPIGELHAISAIIVLLYEVINIALIIKTAIGMKKSLHMNDSKYSQNMRLLTLTTISCVLSVLEFIYEISSLPAIKESSNPLLKWILNQFDEYFLLLLTMNAFSIMLLSKALRQELAQRWHRVQVHSTVRTITTF
ncbi:hypothetical protein KIN20_004279 [Parelaphostrongylus tenuis]|uniref:Serpentine receptor class gamma n=1 Tax=Parelaphostrongylus tenuis TaxID=148309 RepID=A0AAD5QGS6_PARTN|nr:hypothetical protein KIN20_004279 [Parelaphostrongylus tenuis]